MNDGLIPRRYAKALFKQSVENGDAKLIYEQLKELNFRYTAVDELKRVLSNPYIPDEEKGKVMLTAAGAQPGSTLEKFIPLVLRNNRSNMLRKIALAFLRIYRQENRIAKVELASAQPMPDKQRDAILAVVQDKIPDMTLEVTQEIDPELIGGFTVKIDDLLLDASVKNELNQLRLKLLK